MIRIAIVEDNEKERSTLKNLIAQYKKENKCEIETSLFSDGFSFVTNYKCNYDIILMDIDMPKMNGYDAAIKVREKDQQVILIFITNVASYVYKGYQVGAMDYILKPVHYQDLAMRLKLCVKKLTMNNDYNLIINSKSGMNKILASEIIYIESIGHDITIHKLDGDITFRGPSMKSLEAELVSHGFFRSNHCYIVNLKYCDAINENTLSIRGKELEISRSKKASFIDAITRYSA